MKSLHFPSSLALLLALLAPSLAWAQASPVATVPQSSLTLRANYWRDQNTRIIAPEATVAQELPSGTRLEASYLLDAITSASRAAGVSADQPFTELRNELGVRLGQRFGALKLTLGYRHSTESDYWANTGGAAFSLDLLQKNLTLAGSYTYTRASAARRVSPVGYVWANGTEDESSSNAHTAVLGFSQVLSRRALFDAAYELRVEDGWLGNKYRSAKVGASCTVAPNPEMGLAGSGCSGGSAQREVTPTERIGHTASVGVRWTPVYRAPGAKYLTLYLKYRFYGDDWGVLGNTPELRAYWAIGPVELRFSARYDTETPAKFASVGDGVPWYTRAVLFANCPTGGCAVADPKLYGGQDVYGELRVLLDLGFLDHPGVPLGRWLGSGYFALTGGYMRFFDIKGSPMVGWGPEGIVAAAELMVPL